MSQQGSRRLSLLVPLVPFTAVNTTWRSMDRRHKDLAVLDVGCGTGWFGTFTKARRRVSMTGIDIFLPYLQEARKKHSYDAYIRGDVTTLPFKDNSFDCAISISVLEHLDEQGGETLIREMERVARHQVIITCPAGSHPQHAYDDNPHQEHKHVWDPEEMQMLGYRVRGAGMRHTAHLSGGQSPLPAVLRPFSLALWLLASPITYWMPRWAGYMVCIKRLS